MKIPKFTRSLLILAAASGFAVSVVRAEQSPAAVVKISSGAIVGIVTNAAKLPVAGATVTAVKAGGGIRATVSNSEGVYTFADLAPGPWSLTIEVEGYPDVTVPALQVVAGKATRRDVAMNIPAAVAGAPALA